MTVYCNLAVSVDGYVNGPNASPENGLGDGGEVLHEWYWSGDEALPSVPALRPRGESRRLVEKLAGNVGAVIVGRTTYDHSRGWGGEGPHPTATLFVLSHRPAPAGATEQQHFVGSIEEAMEAAGDAAGDADISLMGGELLAAALDAGVVDEIVVHQVPILLGSGTPMFAPRHGTVALELIEAVPTDEVTHLHYRVLR